MRDMNEIVLLNVRIANESIYVVHMLTFHILPSFVNGSQCHCLEIQTSTLWVVANYDVVNIVIGLHTKLKREDSPKPIV